MWSYVITLQVSRLVGLGITNIDEKVIHARDLQEGLQVKTCVNDWIVRQIEKYDLKERKDFSSFWGKSSEG
ncbi:TPA: antA/AntB antirepressor family protein, partial [Bacillus cereus]